jgi:hypothetical protein
MRQMSDDRGRIKKSACFTEDRNRIARLSSDIRRLLSVLRHPSFAGLVVIARSLYPIPFRTRPSKSSAPMVLSLKAWKSRTLPGLPRTDFPLHDNSSSRIRMKKAPRDFRGAFLFARRRSGARQSREPGIHVPSAAIMDSEYLALPGSGMTEKRSFARGPRKRRGTRALVTLHFWNNRCASTLS